MQVNELIEAAMKAQNVPSMRALAERMRVSHTIISRWTSGERAPAFEHVAQLAEMAGLPATKTAAQVRLTTPEGKKHAAILRKLATAAAFLLAVYTAISPEIAQAAGFDIDVTHYALCIIST